MSIISVERLSNELPNDASNADGILSLVVNRASVLVKAHTSNRYDSWDDYDSSTGEAKAPYEIEFICMEVAKAMYFLAIGQVDNDGFGRNIHTQYIKDTKKDLQKIDISTVTLTQNVSLDANDAMLIGERVNNIWTRVIPQVCHVETATSNTWIKDVDFVVRKGGTNTDEYFDAWYLYALDTSLEGVLHYVKTFRSDAGNYARV